MCSENVNSNRCAMNFKITLNMLNSSLFWIAFCLEDGSPRFLLCRRRRLREGTFTCYTTVPNNAFDRVVLYAFEGQIFFKTSIFKVFKQTKLFDSLPSSYLYIFWGYVTIFFWKCKLKTWKEKVSYSVRWLQHVRTILLLFACPHINN